MVTAALFTIAKLWKQSRCPTTGKWIKKMWCLYTIAFYSATKKNEILSFAGKWMELENTNVSEVLVRLRRSTTTFPLICEI
jgi:IS1 family transposase